MKIKLIIVLSLLILSCESIKRNVYKRVFYRMDTVVELTLVLEEPVKRFPFQKIKVSRSDHIFNEIDSLLKDYEIRFSQNSPTSELLTLNNRNSNEVTVSEELYHMLLMGKAYGDTLHGEFDITLLPLKELWGFGKGEGRKEKPSDEDIKNALAKVNYKNFSLESKNRLLFKNENTFIDCGGIAKGAAIEEIAKLLHAIDVKDYLISAGGDILGVGQRIDKTPWKLGIKHPRGAEKPLAIFSLDGGAVVTSGDYERFVEYGGKKYHHLFNTKTGYPSEENMSVTIYASSPVIADILSTGLFSRKANDIISFIEKRPGLECVVVDSSGNVHISKGWKDNINIL